MKPIVDDRGAGLDVLGDHGAGADGAAPSPKMIVIRHPLRHHRDGSFWTAFPSETWQQIKAQASVAARSNQLSALMRPYLPSAVLRFARRSERDPVQNVAVVADRAYYYARGR